MSHHMILGSRLHVPPSRARWARALSVESVESLESRTLLNGASLLGLSGYAAIVESLAMRLAGHAANAQAGHLAKAPTTPKPVTVQPPTTPKPVTAQPPTTPSNPTVQPPTTPSNPATQYVAELTKDFFKSWDNDFAAQSLPTQQQEDQLQADFNTRVTTLLKLYSTVA